MKKLKKYATGSCPAAAAGAAAGDLRKLYQPQSQLKVSKSRSSSAGYGLQSAIL